MPNRPLVRELTTVLAKAKERPGKRCGWQIDDCNDEAETAMEMKGVTFCFSLPRVRRREEVARGGGSLEQGGGAWNDGGHASEAWRRWVALGWLREREGKELEDRERVESNGERQRVFQGGDEGRIGAPRWKQEVAEAARARATPLLCLLAEGRRRACPCGLANRAGPSRWLRWAPGKLAQVSLSLLFIVSVFYYSATLWLY